MTNSTLSPIQAAALEIAADARRDRKARMVEEIHSELKYELGPAATLVGVGDLGDGYRELSTAHGAVVGKMAYPDLSLPHLKFYSAKPKGYFSRRRLRLTRNEAMTILTGLTWPLGTD